MLSSYDTFMFTPRPIGHVRSPYTQTSEVPKGLGAKHDAEGVLEILPEFAPGLLDIKPYLSNVPDEKLRRGWLAEAEARKKSS